MEQLPTVKQKNFDLWHITTFTDLVYFFYQCSLQFLIPCRFLTFPPDLYEMTRKLEVYSFPFSHCCFFFQISIWPSLAVGPSCHSLVRMLGCSRHVRLKDWSLQQKFMPKDGLKNVLHILFCLTMSTNMQQDLNVLKPIWSVKTSWTRTAGVDATTKQHCGLVCSRSLKPKWSLNKHNRQRTVCVPSLEDDTDWPDEGAASWNVTKKR